MNRREFLISFGTALVAVPITLSLKGCGNGGSSSSSSDGFNVVSTVTNAHTHNVEILYADLATPPANGVVYTSDGAGHTHTITLTQQQLTDINNGQTVTVTSSVSGSHTHDWIITKP